jgi:prepilin-type N-terminal cleavage/methylation domain-containing protein
MSVRFRSTKPLPARMLLALANRATNHSSTHPTEQGLSLIECLVAIMVIAITATAITPPILLATGTRIQSRRAEQANQIAQAEVDRVRTIVERGGYSATDLPVSTGQNTGIQDFGAPVSPPGSTILSSATCDPAYPKNKPTSPNELVKVDINGDCKPEFLMQVFRTKGCWPKNVDETTQPPYSFYMGVRVYAYQEGENIPVFDKERATLSMSSTGRKDQVAGNRKPLQTLYTKISRNNDGKSYECVANDQRS